MSKHPLQQDDEVSLHVNQSRNDLRRVEGGRDSESDIPT